MMIPTSDVIFSGFRGDQDVVPARRTSESVRKERINDLVPVFFSNVLRQGGTVVSLNSLLQKTPGSHLCSPDIGIIGEEHVDECFGLRG